MPKNKAAFSLSSHLGLDWSFRTTASSVIVPRHFERIVSVHLYFELRCLGSSLHRVHRAQRSEVHRVFISDHLYMWFVHLGSSLTSRSIPRSISTFGPHSELLRVSAHARTRSASVESSDARRGSPTTNQRTGCSPTANQMKRLHQVQDAAQTMLQLPRQPNQPEK